MKTIVISVRISLPDLASIIDTIECSSGQLVGKSEACRLALEAFASKLNCNFDNYSAFQFLEKRGIFTAEKETNRKKLFNILQEATAIEPTSCNIPQHLVNDVNAALKLFKEDN